MTIKSGKDSIAVDLMAMAVCMFIILLKDGMPWRMSAFCMGPATLVIIMHWFTIGRTVEMNEKGCIIHFLWHRKEYRWEELLVKCVEAYKVTYGRSGMLYTGGVIFSSHKVYKPCKPTFWRHPMDYNLLHPFSFFFVCFQSDLSKGVSDPEIYVVDEAVFIEKMRSWNVELENTRKKITAYLCKQYVLKYYREHMSGGFMCLPLATIN